MLKTNSLLLALKGTILVLSTVVYTHGLFAQESISSQNLFSKVRFNPSFYGASSCNTAILQSRVQWLGLDGPMQFHSATLSMNPAPKIGYGITLNHSEEGIGAFESNDLRVGVASPIMLGKVDNYKLRMGVGIEMGFGQKRLDWSRLVFSSEIHPYLGYLGNNSVISPQNNLSNLYITQSLGVHFQADNHRNGNGFGWGFSLNNGIPFTSLSDLGISFFDESQLAPRYSVHGSFVNTTRYKGDYLGNFRFDYQDGLRTLQGAFSRGFASKYYSDRYMTVVFLGLRNEMFPTAVFNSLIVGFTQTFNDYLVGVSYDMNIEGLSSSYTYGTFELTLRKNFCLRKIGADECFYDNWLDKDKMYRKWEH